MQQAEAKAREADVRDKFEAEAQAKEETDLAATLDSSCARRGAQGSCLVGMVEAAHAVPAPVLS